MFQFENTYFLYGLLLVPLFVLLFVLLSLWKKKAHALYGDVGVLQPLMPDVSITKPLFKFVLFSLAFVSLVIAIANPQLGSKVEKAKRKGVDLFIALDVSNSMMSEDISPSRLQKAGQAISKLIDRLESDRIGVVVFAGKAFVQVPMTYDYSAAKMMLSSLNTDIVQGTAIGSAIELAVESFQITEKTKSKKNKAIIVITDGENHEDDAIEQAKIAADNGIVVHTLGMGLPEGGPIPVYNKGLKTGYKKDREGNTIITKLNETLLQQIAAAGNGRYIRANNTRVGLNKIFDEISKMEEVEFESKMFSEYESHYQYFIAFSLLLLIFEVVIFERKSILAKKINLFKE